MSEVELADERAVRECAPNFAQLATIEPFTIVTAKGESADFVSRFFAPGAASMKTL